MRKLVLIALLSLGLVAAPAAAAPIALQASPNPAVLGQRVVHTVSLGSYGRLDVWVSAKGFAQPGSGSLPAGSWRWECCPTQTAGTAAWHYRSNTLAVPGTYRFGADTRSRGTYLSTASIGTASSSLWVRIT